MGLVNSAWDPRTKCWMHKRWTFALSKCTRSMHRTLISSVNNACGPRTKRWMHKRWTYVLSKCTDPCTKRWMHKYWTFALSKMFTKYEWKEKHKKNKVEDDAYKLQLVLQLQHVLFSYNFVFLKIFLEYGKGK